MNRKHMDFSYATRVLLLVVIVATLSFSGCGRGAPQLTPAKGKLTKGGLPINKAEVRFIPTDETLVGNWVASAVTDEEGNFVLRLPAKEESECVVGQCKVTVNEGPIPDEARRNLEETGDGNAMDRHMQSLKNRPIPKELSRMGTTTFTIEITPDKEVYDLVIP